MRTLVSPGGMRVASDRDTATLVSESGEVTNQTGAGQQDGGAVGVGALVRIRRHAAGLTQQELADLARVSLGTVRDLEQGRTHRPGRGSLTRLASALGLDPARLQTLARNTPELASRGRRRQRAQGLQLRILGPMEAWRDGARVDLGEPRQRAVLAMLALSPDAQVNREALIDAVWGDDPPECAAQVMQTYVSRLRRVLDPGRPPRDPRGLLVSGGTHYRLRVTGEQLDLLAFRQLIDGARAAAAAGEPSAACHAYELALGLWRGEPVSDVDALRDHPAVVQLRRARAAVVLDYADLAGQSGHTDQVLGHLADLVSREPLNEKACARLMLTLAALGQQAAALNAYEDLRLRLDEQLGVLPGPELAEAHIRVLRQEIPPAEADGITTRASELAPEAAGEAMDPGPSVHPPNDTWVAAIHASEHDFAPVGTAVVMDTDRVLTCAHVVVSGDGVAREPLWVSFPKADQWTRRRVAMVTPASSWPVNDLAVLVLQEPVPAGVEAAPLRCPEPGDLVGRPWWAFGFPDRDPVGDSADGVIGAALALGWVRLSTSSGQLVRQGFSGGGLWSPDYQAVVGVVGRAHSNGDSRAITLHQADQCFPHHDLASVASWSTEAAGEVALQQWGWRLARDPEGIRHWRPRARGVSVDSERGYRFRGRAAALHRIVDWLNRPEPDRRVLVITGSPGVGKSAVLGRIVTTADAPICAALPPDDTMVRASSGSVSCAVHAKAKTALEIAEEIARAASAKLPEDAHDLAPAIRDALDGRVGHRFNVIIDALDEAASPVQARSIVDRIVLPLAETCSDVGAQVIVGTRRRDDGGDLLDRFGGALAAIDLDDPEYFAEEDLAAYALACLQLAGDERPGNPYLNEAFAGPLAVRIAAMAGQNFLIAGLIARSHGLHDEKAVDLGQLEFSATVGSALAGYLERLTSVAGVAAGRVLTALAFAEAPGLTAGLWQLAVEATDGTRISTDELTRFARSSAANFLVEASASQSASDHGPSYRLFHQALNDALLHERSDFMPRADDERALTLAFAARGRTSRWEDAPRYLLRSLPSHARASGLVDDLLQDDAYLLHADLRRLLQVAGSSGSASRRGRSRLLRLTPRAITAGPRERAALFSVTEALDDLGTTFRDGDWEAPYRALWASVKPRSERITGGHQGLVNAVCTVTVSGTELLASASGDGTIRIWDPVTGQQRAVLEGHQDCVWSVCSLAQQKVLASASADGTVRTWDPESGQLLKILDGHSGEVNDVCPLSRAGKELLASVGDDRSIRIWDLETGQQCGMLEGHQDWVYAVCQVAAAGSDLLASTCKDGTVRIWDLETGRQRAMLEAHRGEVNSVCPVAVAGQQLLATAGDDGTVRIWDPESGRQFRVLEGHRGGVNDVCPVTVASQPLLASAGADRTVRIWDPGSGQQRVLLECHRGGVTSVCPVMAGGKELLATAGSDGDVRTWDPETGQLRAMLEGREWVNSVCQTTVAGTELLATCDYRTVRIWDPHTGRQLRVLEGHDHWVNGVCPVTVAGRELLASACDDRTVRIWDPAAGQQRAVLEGHRDPLYSVCSLTVAGQGLLASAGGDGTVRIWDPVAGQQRAVLEGHRGEANGVCPLTVAGRELLASVGDDGMARIWDPETGACQLSIPTHYPAVSVAWVAESVVIGLAAGILVIRPQASGW
jgi:WD40 repeat protein/DNA-binding SARP family transcriptional activator